MRVLVSPVGLICGAYRWKGVVSDPVADGLAVEVERELRFAGPVIEVLNGDVVGARGFVERSREAAAGGLVADGGYAVGGGLPRLNVNGRVAFGGHVFGFDAVGIIAYTA